MNKKVKVKLATKCIVSERMVTDWFLCEEELDNYRELMPYYLVRNDDETLIEIENLLTTYKEYVGMFEDSEKSEFPGLLQDLICNDYQLRLLFDGFTDFIEIADILAKESYDEGILTCLNAINFQGYNTWSFESIHGSVQGEYATVFFPKNICDLYEANLEMFETLYFNLGREYEISYRDGEYFVVYIFCKYHFNDDIVERYINEIYLEELKPEQIKFEHLI